MLLATERASHARHVHVTCSCMRTRMRACVHGVCTARRVHAYLEAESGIELPVLISMLKLQRTPRLALPVHHLIVEDLMLGEQLPDARAWLPAERGCEEGRAPRVHLNLCCLALLDDHSGARVFHCGAEGAEQRRARGGGAYTAEMGQGG